MGTWILTVNCYEPPFRERMEVSALTLDGAFRRAKDKARRKNGGKIEDYHVTATETVKEAK